MKNHFLRKKGIEHIFVKQCNLKNLPTNDRDFKHLFQSTNQQKKSANKIKADLKFV